jgi:hypothetical protein
MYFDDIYIYMYMYDPYVLPFMIVLVHRDTSILYMFRFEYVQQTKQASRSLPYSPYSSSQCCVKTLLIYKWCSIKNNIFWTLYYNSFEFKITCQCGFLILT